MDPVAFAKLLETSEKQGLTRKQICAEYDIKPNFVLLKPKTNDFSTPELSQLATKIQGNIEVVTPKGFPLKIPAEFNEETFYRILRILELGCWEASLTHGYFDAKIPPICVKVMLDSPT